MAFQSTINSHFSIFGLAFGGLTELSFPGPFQARCIPAQYPRREPFFAARKRVFRTIFGPIRHIWQGVANLGPEIFLISLNFDYKRNPSSQNVPLVKRRISTRGIRDWGKAGLDLSGIQK
jgi:hypothetical protein